VKPLAEPGKLSRPDFRGRGTLVLFALGGSVLYIAAILGITLALGEHLPARGWIGFGIAATVALAAGAGLALFLVRSSEGGGPRAAVRRPAGPSGARRVLVVADEACSAEAVCGTLAERLGDRPADVLVVAPALVSPLHYLDSDVDRARAAARARLEETIGGLNSAGIAAHGRVGSEIPLEAISDALADFPADEIVIVSPPPDRENWLEHDLVARARDRYDVPIAHLALEAPRLSAVG
jgi:hypothetical protein